uniref:REM-1 domain-containing protein n=1 Tax=Paramormyrops kingsleyae TaxID=1676925 RepID=A0A3B3SJ03_9TELE
MEEKLHILEDLNMIYIRQIALSLQDSDIQKKIDYEIRMRDGACKLLAACSQRDQALEASKSLLTCNARIMAYMSELQRMKEAQVLQRAVRRSSDGGPRLPCKGKVAISDLRIPLMWKDTEYFKNKGGELGVRLFCLQKDDQGCISNGSISQRWDLKWMEMSLYSHLSYLGQWKQCCDDVMKIETPSPRKPAIITAKQQGSLYNEMATPLSASSSEGLLLQDNAVSAEIRALLSSYYNDR